MDLNGFMISRTLLSGICKGSMVLVGTGKITYEDRSEAGIKDGVYLYDMFTMEM